MKLYFSILILLIASAPVFSQKTSWKKLDKEGDVFEEQGKYLKAAEAYAAAFKIKPDKEKIASKAGAAFFNARYYTKALKMLRPIKKEAKEYPLAGFWYAKSLKAMGEFDKAAKAFKNFRRTYPGEKTDHVMDMARTEIEGCEMGMDWEGLPVIEKAQALSVNSTSEEFGVTAFSDDIIYYGTDQNGTVKMMRSQNANGDWSTPIAPDFPSGPSGHTSQGAFNVDRSAFYFTICDNSKPWNSREANCEIYASKIDGDNWGTPEKLRDYLKGDGTTATHPFVYQDGEMEVLIYSTNRSGGKGGMDLWKTSRPLNSDAFDFSFPQHMGRNINSKGDEITPFVNLSNGTLNFSSNGFANLGGFDIFSVPLNDLEEGYVENMGYPYNSNSDDYYYTMAPMGTIEFFTSNRSTVDWATTTDDNLFQVGMASNPMATVSGVVKDASSKEGVMHSNVLLMEISGDDEMLLTTQATNDGAFELPVVAGKNYRIEANADGYQSNQIALTEEETSAGANLVKTIYLEEAEMIDALITEASNTTNTVTETVNTWVSNTSDVVETASSDFEDGWSTATKVGNERTTSNVNSKPYESNSYEAPKTVINSYSSSTNNSSNTYSNKSSVADYSSSSNQYTNSRFMGDGVRTTAPKHTGSYYKVQLSIVIDYNSGEADYQSIKDLGRIDTEYIIARGWTRVLIADYFSKEEALRVLYEARQRGFAEAFLVRYENGFRKI